MSHGFYMALAYGVAALAIGLEVWGLWRRFARARAHAATKECL